ncbi:hypothetical protein IMZ29_03880 [Achromobacter sp. GG226]|uniref:hypothetical protein n=1 Tax=Verticiella alkaliphila TaxID=2779529 RepID=UPI001C0E876A|nr:hypothetical protein [Verticiella sp. GG226]MBU4609718.1 hypothetical protein [Verticiella sp. GG226]
MSVDHTRWKLTPDVAVGLSAECRPASISKFMGWPSGLACPEPRVSLSARGGAQYTLEYEGERLPSTRYAWQTSDFSRKASAVEDALAVTLYRHTVSVFDGKISESQAGKFNLLRFAEEIGRLKNVAKRIAQAQIREKQNELIVSFFVLFVGGILIVVTLWQAARWARGKSSEKIEHLRRANQQREDAKIIRHAGIDEATRHAVRAGLSQANEVEIAALRKQIVAAVEAGETETAKTLMGILQRLENSADDG